MFVLTLVTLYMWIRPLCPKGQYLLLLIRQTCRWRVTQIKSRYPVLDLKQRNDIFFCQAPKWKPWWKPNITDRSFPLHPAGITEGISCCGASHIPRASPSATEMLKVGQCLSKKDTASGVPSIQPLLCTPGRETKSQREKAISPMLTQEILRHLYPMGYSRTVSWDNADLTQKRRFVPVNIWNSPAVEWLINFRSISIILPISHTFCCT